ncbi:carbohydrate ABC transporter permease [Cohnella fermenti]|uniref:Sugar ABC transporter permease n=1 Tax=Cohnella fermenti TaxID=2565925 RepID=A0A4S4C7X8_9BACL|nr:sugar ABC transporter permease [Cohnella fermenti]THF83432.1 sugar ABC transporter permease [Cohnella fermenti]
MLRLARRINERLHRYMAVPALALFAVFFVTPLVKGIRISLTDWNGLAPDYHYVGLSNFIEFFHDDRAIHALKVTLTFGLISPVLLCAAGLLYALLLDNRLRGRGAVRTFVYLPAIISPLIMGYVWLLLLNSENGALLEVLKIFGRESVYRDWLGTPDEALWVIIAVNLWQFVGYAMIIFLAGLQGISADVLEAAKVDGAGYWTSVRRIVAPLLMPAIRINVITNLIGSLGVFDVITALTDGGPGYSTESMSIYIMRSSFNGHTGYATAVAVLMFLVILIPVSVALRLMKQADQDG